jgi:hypothetical protein
MLAFKKCFSLKNAYPHWTYKWLFKKLIVIGIENLKEVLKDNMF